MNGAELYIDVEGLRVTCLVYLAALILMTYPELNLPSQKILARAV